MHLEEAENLHFLLFAKWIELVICKFLAQSGQLFARALESLQGRRKGNTKNLRLFGQVLLS
jgi:hypothetical protein